MPVSALNSSVAAMYRATDRFESSATKIADPAAKADLGTEAVNLVAAQHEFELASSVIKVTSDLEKHVLDILA